MLVNGLLNLLLALLRVLLLPLRMATIPATVLETFDAALVYILDGFSIIAFYTHFSYMLVLFTISLDVYAITIGYDGICFILRHVPFLGQTD